MTEEVEGLFTTAEATRYVSEQVQAKDLNLQPRGVLKYVRDPEFHLLRGTKKGRVLLFTRPELDEFVTWYMETKPRPGVRPGTSWADQPGRAGKTESPEPPPGE